MFSCIVFIIASFEYLVRLTIPFTSDLAIWMLASLCKRFRRCSVTKDFLYLLAGIHFSSHFILAIMENLLTVFVYVLGLLELSPATRDLNFPMTESTKSRAPPTSRKRPLSSSQTLMYKLKAPWNKTRHIYDSGNLFPVTFIWLNTK